MFGLRNFRGSCWVNACLQGIFRLPETQTRYSTPHSDEVESALHKIWSTQGEEGLEEFFRTVKVARLPAGQNIGDSHELLHYLCDKLPWLDSLCRFKIADRVSCSTCKKTELKEDTTLELTLYPETPGLSLSEAIREMVVPSVIPDWTCETCKHKGCTKQFLIGTFPKVMMFYVASAPVKYASVLMINARKYCLLSVLCYNGSHWWCYGRNMPPGNQWYTLDDTRAIPHRGDEFPLSETVRVLVYYRLDD
jgi:ubiquitin C-terminal hydrolase